MGDLKSSNAIIIDEYAYIPKARHLETTAIYTLIEDAYKNNRHRTLELLEAFVSYSRHLYDLALHPDQNNELSPSWVNGWVPAFDAVSIYCMVALAEPDRYIEVGSGNTTKFAARAIADHSLATKIISIDPQPRAGIDTLCNEIFRLPLENMDINFFKTISHRDILIVDNSHRAFSNSDVTVFFTEILPLLPSGVNYAIHDIYLPFDYPSTWIEAEKRHYNEQYMLAVYLLGGAMGDAITLPLYYLSSLDECKNIMEKLWGVNSPLSIVEKFGGFFWMKKR